MGASLHAQAGDLQHWLDDTHGYIDEHGETRMLDVTALRDSDAVPHYIKHALYADELEPGQALLVRDALRRFVEHETRAGAAERQHLLRVADWLGHWGREGVAVSGMH